MASVHRITRVEHERNIVIERKRETVRQEVLDNIIMHERNLARAEAEENAFGHKGVRIAGQQKMECNLEESIIKAQREKKIREQQEIQEEALARELQRIKMEKECDEKMRQQVREASIEIRELESQLKAAYASKEHKAQMAEKLAAKQEEKARDIEAAQVMAEKAKREEEVERQRDLFRMMANKQYHDELDRQIQEEEERKGRSSNERVKDKMLVDEIVRKTIEEDEKARELARKKREMIYGHMLQERERRLQQYQDEHLRNVVEEERIAKFAREKAMRDEQRKAAKLEQNETREKFQKQIAAKIAEEHDYTEELEQMRLELSQEEQQEKDRQKELAELEKRRQMRQDLQQAVGLVSVERERRIQDARDNEEYYLRQMIVKWAEDDRVELMNAQKRRLKMLEYRELGEKLIAERHNLAQAEKQRERDYLAEQKKLSEYQKLIIEEERKRLLLEHAPKLLGYLPKGVIRHEKDLELLGDEFKEAYSKQPGDPFNDSRIVFDE